MEELSNYIVPVIGGSTLMVLCWFMGQYRFSVMWILFFVLLNVIKSKLWKERQRRIIALQQTALREKEVVMAQLKDLPAWVQFPDTERVEWMNKVIYQLWPYIGEYCRKFIKEIVEPQIKAHMPGAFKSFRFEEIDIGDIPLRVGGIKVYQDNVGRDRIVMDMDVAYAGDCEFVVAVGAFKGGLKQVQFKGKLRAVLNPLLPKPPMIGGVSAFFLDVPTIDFDLTGLGEFVELPGLIGAVRSVINTQVASICVLPNEIVVPLTTETDVVKLYFPEPDGIVRIHVMDARNLENADIVLRGKSDPYTRLSVGGQNFKTKTIDNSLNPTWDEFFEAVVDQASGQKLIAETFDDDPGSNDDFLGRMSLDLSVVKEKGVVDEWYPLEGVKHGDLHLITYWFNLSKDATLAARHHELQYGKPRTKFNTAVLMIYIDNASNLPSSKQDLEPSPFVEFTMGNETQKTFPRPKTRNPLYRQKFIFFVSNVDQQTLKIEGKDDSTGGRTLGECTLPIRSLLKEKDLEVYQQTFYLTLGPHSSPLVMTARLRFLQLGHHGALNLVSENKNLTVTTGKQLESLSQTDSGLPSPQKSQESSILESYSMTQSGSLPWKKMKRKGLSQQQFDGPLGKINVSLSYSCKRKKFIVQVKSVQNLRPIGKDNFADPYVSVKFLKSGLLYMKKKTPIFKNTLNPTFGETFEFDVTDADLALCTLVLDVKDASKSSWFKQTPVLGQVIYDLTRFTENGTVTEGLDLRIPCYYRETSERKPSTKSTDKNLSNR